MYDIKPKAEGIVFLFYRIRNNNRQVLARNVPRPATTTVAVVLDGEKCPQKRSCAAVCLFDDDTTGLTLT